MIGFLEAVLALVGFVAVVLVCAVFVSAWYDERRIAAAPVPEPYRHGLDATARLSAMAFEAAQAMHHAAGQSREDE
jgi:predicted signal transduction protein with EAL and GGDEF domain